MTKPLLLIDPAPRTREMILSDDAFGRLQGMAEIVMHLDGRMPDALVDANIARADVIIGQTAMPAARIERAQRLKAIVNVKGNWETNVDYALCQARGIQVLTIAPAMAPAVAEACLGFAIDLARGITRNDRRFRAGEDRYGIKGNGDAYTLYGADVGFIGFGNLGRSLRPLLQPFGCRVAVHDPYLAPGYLRDHGCAPAGLDEVLSRSRFLFILAGVTSENEGFLDRAKLSLVPKDAAVVLASRAEVTDFDAFVELAEAGAFRAAIDVFPVEPVPPDAPVRRTRNILLSSHLAGGMWASYARICEMLMDDLPLLLQGLPATRLQRAEPRLAAMQRSR